MDEQDDADVAGYAELTTATADLKEHLAALAQAYPTSVGLGGFVNGDVRGVVIAANEEMYMSRDAVYQLRCLAQIIGSLPEEPLRAFQSELNSVLNKIELLKDKIAEIRLEHRVPEKEEERDE